MISDTPKGSIMQCSGSLARSWGYYIHTYIHTYIANMGSVQNHLRFLPGQKMPTSCRRNYFNFGVGPMKKLIGWLCGEACSHRPCLVWSQSDFFWANARYVCRFMIHMTFFGSKNKPHTIQPLNIWMNSHYVFCPVPICVCSLFHIISM